MIIIVFLLFIIAVVMVYTNYNYVENFENYGKVSEDRNNICSLYLDAFANTYRSAPNIVNVRFDQWCNEYTQKLGFYPRYRTGELAYTGLYNYYTTDSYGIL